MQSFRMIEALEPRSLLSSAYVAVQGDVLFIHGLNAKGTTISVTMAADGKNLSVVNSGIKGVSATLVAMDIINSIWIVCGRGNDTVTIDPSVHYLTATIRGGAGNDSITGGNGADLIYGGPGKDTLVGGAGDDRIYGGRGDDTVKRDSMDTKGPFLGPGHDVIFA